MLFSRTQANTTSTVGIVLTSPTRRATEVAAVCTWHWAQRPNVICLGWSLVPAAACRSIQYCRSRPARSQEVMQRSFCRSAGRQLEFPSVSCTSKQCCLQFPGNCAMPRQSLNGFYSNALRAPQASSTLSLLPPNGLLSILHPRTCSIRLAQNTISTASPPPYK